MNYGHPRPQLQRAWTCLNQSCDFVLDPDAKLALPNQIDWNGASKINLPYAPESPASGISAAGFFKACWYRILADKPRIKRGERVILHFGAVDHEATVWVNREFAVFHEGGYTPFSCDITDYLTRGRGKKQEIVVRAYDDPLDMEKPRGKQDWKRDPHGIWYPRTTGIWQTVWMEVVPETRIERLRWTSSVQDWCLNLFAQIHGTRADSLQLRVAISLKGTELANDVYSVRGGQVERTIAMPDPGIGDARNEFTWHPDHPHLFDAVLQLEDKRGRIIDRVTSYTALRELSWAGDRVLLNGDVIRMRLALDQGYWREGGLTGDDEAQKRDVELAKDAGFNGVRKHQKVEDPRYLYWADQLGLLVWEEMPSAYSFSPRAMRRVTNEWLAVLERDFSHPSVVCHVPINESWMVPDLPVSAEQRDFVRALYYLTKAYDPTRPAVCNSGWEAVLSADIITVHDYDSNAQSFAARYVDTDENLTRLFSRLRPGGRLLLLDDATIKNKVLGIDEMGGVKFDVDAKEGEESWGYSEVKTPEEFIKRYSGLVWSVAHHPRISIWCWTQLTDTYQEKNGVYTMDRESKADIVKIRQASWGWFGG